MSDEHFAVNRLIERLQMRNRLQQFGLTRQDVEAEVVKAFAPLPDEPAGPIRVGESLMIHAADAERSGWMMSGVSRLFEWREVVEIAKDQGFMIEDVAIVPCASLDSTAA